MFKKIRLIMALVFLGLCSGSLMAQTVSGSYMISSTNGFGTHYLAFDGTSLADATTFNPATCMWDVEITDGTCTVSMDGNYLTMSGSTVAIGTPATTFTISDGKLMAGGNYLVFDNEWKAVDNNGYKCYLSSPAEGIPYMISYDGNYLGYRVNGKNVEIINETFFNPATCIWYLTSDNKLRTNVLTVNNQQKIFYLKFPKDDNASLDANGSVVSQDLSNNSFYYQNNGPTKLIYLIYDNNKWKGTKEISAFPANAGIYSQLEIYSITDGVKYLGVNGASIEYSTTASQWFAETSGAGKTLHQGSNYLTLGTTLGNLPDLAATGTSFDLTDNHIYNGTTYLGFTGWIGSTSATGAATLTGPTRTFLITDGTHFMTVSSGAVANSTFNPHTCVWTAIPNGSGGYYFIISDGENTYYLKGVDNALSLSRDISDATSFSINGHVLTYVYNNKSYAIGYANNNWKPVQNGTAAVYYEFTTTFVPEQESEPVTATIQYGSHSFTETSVYDPGTYVDAEEVVMPDLGKYYFKGALSGNYTGHPEYYRYDIQDASFSVTTYYEMGGNIITALPEPVAGWTLTQVSTPATGLHAATEFLHIETTTEGIDLTYGSRTKGNKLTGWGAANFDYVKGEPQLVTLNYGYSYAGVPVAGTSVNLIVKAPTWKDYICSQPDTYDTDVTDDILSISCEEDLAWLISVVDGLNGQTCNPYANTTVVIERDLDMSEYQWCPLGTHQNVAYFSCNIDGCGHIIKGLRCSLYVIPGNNETGGNKNETGGDQLDRISVHLEAVRGFIGNFYASGAEPIIENIFFEDVEIGWPGAGSDYGGSSATHHVIGGIVAGSDEGSFTVRNCGISGRIFAGTPDGPDTYTTVGGLAGYVGGSGTFESCYSVATVEGANVGGLVGSLASGTVVNCFANPILKVYGSTSTSFGGLVGSFSGGTFENCYVRLRNTPEDGALPSCFKLFASSGTAKYCYAYETQANAAVGGTGNYALGANTDCGLYSSSTPYKYFKENNVLTHINGSTTGSSQYALVSTSLLDALNSYVEANSSITTRWARTTSDINEDYPILRFDDFNNIFSKRLEGHPATGADGPTTELLDPFMYYKPTLLEGFAAVNNDENTNAILYFPYGGIIALYKNEDITGENVGYDEEKVKFYIDEEASLLHDDNSPLKAYVGVTFRNELQGVLNHGTPANCYWHMLSSPLVTNSTPLGIDYNGDNTQYNAYPVIDDNLPPYGWLTEGDLTGNGYFADDTPYDAYDFYSWYEPEYQWVNFKRNGPSHWHEDTHLSGGQQIHDHFDYKPEVGGTTNVNESYLIPGKGYLMAIDKQMFLQTHGTLNQGDVTYPITCSAEYIPGYNFIGNPYHSYLDIEAFFNENKDQIWQSASSKGYRQIKLINGNEYVDYTIGASKDAAVAPRYINMHQGFLVVADKNGTVTFTNAMRSNSGTPDFREAKINYPLINLHVTDENGYGEVAVVEVGRPERGGARKAHEISRADCILYAHQGDEDYSVLFLEEGISSTGVWFEPFSDGQFTMKWDTHNGTFDYLHLIDNIAGVDIDCTTTDSYTFQSSTSDYKSRFKLVFSYTGVEENEEDASTGSASFAFQSGDNLIVNGEGRLEIIDMNGRLISATELYGAQNAIAMPNVAQGVYLLRQISNNNVKVQKIVVR